MFGIESVNLLYFLRSFISLKIYQNSFFFLGSNSVLFDVGHSFGVYNQKDLH